MIELIDKHKTARILGCSPDTLRLYVRQGKLRENIHLLRQNSRVNRYVKVLIEDLAINWSDPAAHERAIENYYSSLSLFSNQPRKSGRRPNDI